MKSAPKAILPNLPLWFEARNRFKLSQVIKDNEDKKVWRRERKAQFAELEPAIVLEQSPQVSTANFY